MIIQDSLKGFPGIIGRMERVNCERDDIAVFIDYAHTPDALENLLSSVRRFCKRDEYVTLVFGCGGDRDATKRPLMGAIASKYADRVIVTSDNPRSEDSVNIIFDILSGVDKTKPYMAISDRRDAIEYAIFTAKKNEVVLLAGKGHEKYEIDAGGKHPFNEAEIARAAYAEIARGR